MVGSCTVVGTWLLYKSFGESLTLVMVTTLRDILEQECGRDAFYLNIGSGKNFHFIQSFAKRVVCLYVSLSFGQGI